MSLRSSRKGKTSTSGSANASQNNTSTCDKEDEDEEPVQRPELLRITRATATSCAAGMETRASGNTSACPFEETQDSQDTNDVHNVAESSPTQDDKKTAQSTQATVSRVYKKCASNGSLAVYVGTRTLAVIEDHLEPLKGVLVFDKDSLAQSVSENFRIWGQINLTFRYGREDEEVLGLRFCNEAILALKQLWPPLKDDPEEVETEEDEELTPLQVVLLERVNSSTSTQSTSIQSIPFTLCAGPVGMGAFPPPPSVLLAPAKPYRGSPIGTIYDLRIYASERPEERPPRRNLIRLALRAVQMPIVASPYNLAGSVEGRPTFLSRGKIRFQCELNKSAVHYGEPLEVKLAVHNGSRSSIRKVMVTLIQQVDVCMFTSGKFKNIVGSVEDSIVLVPGASCQKSYMIIPTRGPARQWLALEEAFGREPVLAPSTSTMDPQATELRPFDCPSSKDKSGATSTTNPQRNVFAIIVSYYVKAKLILGGLSLCQNVKVPFILLPPENPDDTDPYPSVTPSTLSNQVRRRVMECSTTSTTSVTTNANITTTTATISSSSVVHDSTSSGATPPSGGNPQIRGSSSSSTHNS